MTIKLSKVTCDTGSSATKTYNLVKGVVKSTGNLALSNGKCETIAVSSLTDLNITLNNLSSNQLVVHGTVQDNLQDSICKIITREKLAAKKLAAKKKNDTLDNLIITRTKDYFSYDARLNLAMFDLDKEDLEKFNITSPEEFIEIIRNIIPEFKGVEFLVRNSNSSNIYKYGKLMTSSLGYHIYFFATKQNLLIIKDVLMAKLSQDYHYVKVSKKGALLDRFVIDMSVFSPERCDYAAKPKLGYGLEKVDCDGYIIPKINGTGNLDLRLSITDKEKINAARLRVERKALITPTRKLNALEKELISIEKPKTPKAKANIKARAAKIVKNSSDTDFIPMNFVVYTIANERYTIQDLLDNPNKFEHERLSYPISPELNESVDEYDTIFNYNNGKDSNLFFFGSGGVLLKLKTPEIRQCINSKNLTEYVVKGDKLASNYVGQDNITIIYDYNHLTQINYNAVLVVNNADDLYQNMYLQRRWCKSNDLDNIKKPLKQAEMFELLFTMEYSQSHVLAYGKYLLNKQVKLHIINVENFICLFNHLTCTDKTIELLEKKYNKSVSDNLSELNVTEFEYSQENDSFIIPSMVCDIVDNNRFNVINSDIGTGKTSLLIKQQIDKLAPGKTAIIITHQSTLSKQNAKMLGGIDYRNNDSIPHCKLLCTTIHSLGKTAVKDHLLNADLVIIDECLSVYQQLTNGLVKDGLKIPLFHMLSNKLSNPNCKVILSDANTEDSLLNYFNNLALRNHGEMILLRPTKESKEQLLAKKTFTFHDHFESTVKQLIDDAKSDVVVSFTSDSKKLVHAINEELSQHGLKTFTITGDNSLHDNTIHFLANIDSNVEELQVFGYSPSVGTGISNNSTNIERMYCFYNDVVSIDTFEQMCFRNRKVNEFHIAYKCRSQFRTSPHNLRTNSDDLTQFTTLEEQQQLNDMLFYNLMINLKYHESNHSIDALLHKILNKGGQVLFQAKPESSKKNTKEVKDLVKMHKEQNYDAIIEAGKETKLEDARLMARGILEQISKGKIVKDIHEKAIIAMSTFYEDYLTHEHLELESELPSILKLVSPSFETLSDCKKADKLLQNNIQQGLHQHFVLKFQLGELCKQLSDNPYQHDSDIVIEVGKFITANRTAINGLLGVNWSRNQLIRNPITYINKLLKKFGYGTTKKRLNKDANGVRHSQHKAILNPIILKVIKSRLEDNINVVTIAEHTVFDKKSLQKSINLKYIQDLDKNS